jgi:hypothetical protein
MTFDGSAYIPSISLDLGNNDQQQQQQKVGAVPPSLSLSLLLSLLTPLPTI